MFGIITVAIREHTMAEMLNFEMWVILWYMVLVLYYEEKLPRGNHIFSPWLAEGQLEI